MRGLHYPILRRIPPKIVLSTKNAMILLVRASLELAHQLIEAGADRSAGSPVPFRSAETIEW